MNFIKFVFKNAFRKKSRTVFTLSGITIPVVIILFYGLTIGFAGDSSNSNFDLEFHPVSSQNSNYINESKGAPYINESFINELKNEKDIGGVVGVYYTHFNNNDTSFDILGFKESDQIFMKLNILSGRIFSDDEKELVIVKKELQKLNKTIGDNISIANETYKIVGTTDYHPYLDAFTSLNNARNIDSDLVNRLNSNGEKIGSINVKIKSGYNVAEVGKRIEEEYKSRNESNDIESSHEDDIATNIFIYIEKLFPEIIAILITFVFTIKSVHDRTKEIGILKAIGWRSRRIFAMIIGETIILSICSFIIGSVLSIIAYFVMETKIYDLKLDFITFLQTLEINIFFYAFLIVIFIALLSALFPAIKASRLSPTEALKYE